MELPSLRTLQQHHTLTPYLGLALNVLRMPRLQLQAYLRQQVEENPLLEVLEESPERADPDAEPSLDDDSRNEPEDGMQDLWREADGSPADRIAEERPRQEWPARPPSLQEHLLCQLRCLDAEETIRQAAETLVGWVDPDGYLRSPLEDIAREEQLDVLLIERALRLIHRLDPPGIGARSLPERLLIQLDHRNLAESLAARIIRDHVELLAKRNLRQLAARLRVSLTEAQQACAVIAQLDPAPARNFAVEAAPRLIPDLIVQELAGEYHVELNDDDLPRLGLNDQYRGLLRDPAASPDARQFIREKLREARWLLRALGQRKATVLAIAQYLVKLEQGYLAHGVHSLRPLTQEEVARSVGCHPSTVSRAIAEKTIQTPHGIVPLERFFGGGLTGGQDAANRISAHTIRAELAQLIDNEDSVHPLSDQALAGALRARGYPVARRTVTKYREQSNIPPAHLRRQLPV